jgi:hypothetical protein
MMLLAAHALQWLIVLMEKGLSTDFYSILMFSFQSNPIMDSLRSRCFD